jgi:predicted acylesterase/phospholipase RssA
MVKSLDRRGTVDVQWLRLLAGCLLRWCGVSLPDALVRGDHFHRTIAAGLKKQTFEECLIPFRCIACTDGAPLQRRVFRAGSLLSAISASMSLPGVLMARQPDGTRQRGFYDGGIVEKTPMRSPIADHLRSGERRRLLLLGTHFSAEATQLEVACGFIARFTSTIHAMESLVWSYQHAEAAKRPEVTLLLFDPHLSDRSSFDFSKAEQTYLNAKLALSLALP